MEAQFYNRLGLSNWNWKYLSQAVFISGWSKDPSKKVGCVISNEFDIPIGQGFNGFPKGVKDDPEVMKDKERKRLRMVHAEMNAISFSTKELSGSTFHVTHRVCAACARNIIQHRPKKVISLYDDTGTLPELSEYWKTSMKEASAMFKEADIDYVHVPWGNMFEWYNFVGVNKQV